MSEEILEPITNESMETMEDYKQELEASFQQIKEGDILTGTVISVTDTEVMLDLKSYTDGIITAEHLSNDPNFDVKNEIHIGDQISATVIQRDNGEGHILLSRKEANDRIAWNKLKTYMENGTVLSIKISGLVNKGVITYVEGIRGFIPASKLSTSYIENTDEWLNKIIDVIVITVEPENKKLVLSGKEPAMEKLTKEKSEKVSKITVGSVIDGIVDSIKLYGAFIALDNGLTGLLHISQICEKRIKTPAAVLSEGQKVTVKIIGTDNGKLSLSMKALVDAADTAEENFDYELPKSESIGTGLASLLKNIKLDN